MKLEKNDNESDKKDKESSRGIQQHNFLLEITRKREREKEWTTTELYSRETCVISRRFIFSPVIGDMIVENMIFSWHQMKSLHNSYLHFQDRRQTFVITYPSKKIRLQWSLSHWSSLVRSPVGRERPVKVKRQTTFITFPKIPSHVSRYDSFESSCHGVQLSLWSFASHRQTPSLLLDRNCITRN